MLPKDFYRDQFITELRAKHARILPPTVDFAVEDGWLPLISDSLQAFEACLEKHGWIGRAGVRQIKEKLGDLRIYVKPRNASAHFPKALQHDLTAIYDNAVSISLKTCELCGDVGALDTYDGYWQTLCDRHGNERRAWIAAGKPGTPAEYAAKMREAGDD